MRGLLHFAVFTVLMALAPACDKSDLKLDKKTERELQRVAKSTKKVAQSAAKSTEKVAKSAGKELKKLAVEAVKEAQKPAPEKANIPDLAKSDGRGEVSIECRAVDVGNPFAVADENRWRGNARCR